MGLLAKIANRTAVVVLVLQGLLPPSCTLAVFAAPTLASLDNDVWRVESVREVKDVTRSFAHLAQYGRFAEMAALFAENGTLVWGGARKEDVAAATTSTGPSTIEAALRADAGDMDGITPGSMNLWIVETPVVTLSTDGLSAKARWNTLQFMGDGAGGTKIQGGIWENQYVQVGSGSNATWKFSVLHYYQMYKGDWAQGWKNIGSGNRALPIVPYHFTPDSAGIPIMLPESNASSKPTKGLPGQAATSLIVAELATRIALLNDEDEVRNLQHSYGYYLDRRMWTDVVDLFTADGTITISGNTIASSAAEVRDALETLWGPEGITRGVLNDHPMFDTVVDVMSENEAIVRGIEVGMIGNYDDQLSHWEFGAYRNRFVKDPGSGLWKIKDIDLTHVMEANYGLGWGYGGVWPSRTSSVVPDFIDIQRQRRINSRRKSPPPTTTAISLQDLADLQRRLGRSSAFDGSENDSSAYGYWADDIRCDNLGYIHAAKGHKESPGTGWFYTADRIAKACHARYGAYDNDPMRGSIPFHWRPQIVVHVSQDGRSAGVRARLLQFGTSTGGGSSFGGGMYSDQTVLEKETGLWKLWSTTIDEFYWQSSSWSAGWARSGQSSSPSSSSSRTSTSTSTRPRPTTTASPTSTRPSATPSQSQPPSPSNGGLASYPPDVNLTHPLLKPRENGFSGGPPPRTSWPLITTMWFPYRNPVSGRLPGQGNTSFYWPGCVPCHADGPRPAWSLPNNGYQEPPTGPSLITVRADVVSGDRDSVESSPAVTVTVSVAGGPGELAGAGGVVELRRSEDEGALLGSLALDSDSNGNAVFKLPTGPGSALVGGVNKLAVVFRGSERLSQGKAEVLVTLPEVSATI